MYSFGHFLIALCPFYTVAPKTAPKTHSEAALVQENPLPFLAGDAVPDVPRDTDGHPTPLKC